MSLVVGDNKINKLYLGNTKIVTGYLQNNKVFTENKEILSVQNIHNEVDGVTKEEKK